MHVRKTEVLLTNLETGNNLSAMCKSLHEEVLVPEVIRATEWGNVYYC